MEKINSTKFVEESLSEANKIYDRLRYKLNTSGCPLKIVPFKNIGAFAAMNFKETRIASEEVIMSKEKEDWGRVYTHLAHELGHFRYHPGSIRRWHKLQEIVSGIIGAKDYSSRIFNIYTDTIANYTLLHDLRVRDDYETGGYIKGMVLDFGLETDGFLITLVRYLHFEKKKSEKELIRMFPRIKNIIWRPDPRYMDVIERISNILLIEPNDNEKYAWKLSPWHSPDWVLHCYLQYMAYVEFEKMDLKTFLEKEDALIWFKKLLGVDMQKDLLDLFNMIHHYRDIGYESEDDPALLRKIMILIFKYFNIFPQSSDGINKGIIQCPHCKYIDCDLEFKKGLSCDVSGFPNIKISFLCPKCKKNFVLIRVFDYKKRLNRCVNCGETDPKKLKTSYHSYDPHGFKEYIQCKSCGETIENTFFALRGLQCPYCLGRNDSRQYGYAEITKVEDVIPPPPGFNYYAVFYCHDCEKPDGKGLNKPLGKIIKKTVGETPEKVFNWW